MSIKEDEDKRAVEILFEGQSNGKKATTADIAWANLRIQEQARGILSREFVKPYDIAWALETLEKREYKNHEVRIRLQIKKLGFINQLGLQTYCKDGRLSMQINGVRELTLDDEGKKIPEDITEGQYVIVEDVKNAMIGSGQPWPIDAFISQVQSSKVVDGVEPSKSKEAYAVPKFKNVTERNSWILVMKAAKVEVKEIIRLWNQANHERQIDENTIKNAGRANKSSSSIAIQNSAFSTVKVVSVQRKN